ncbi:quercetin dioxygenase-like cupin family protein [Herbihabitans rhizosphaerae]|uniref:Quercetin dioxygenase-like cupin family protein n=1 Tax=Herbihabitans rhizosphaerae TaxID=1872711 RepID=A0A4Q7KJ63_9PSEU|nr:cupin domain-containing protein [Herbihabitans rhizosphaerae]RZS33896.1 quercetin dioxygenase-like cupin family protein [Herbihabitans rhizosphaerae]
MSVVHAGDAEVHEMHGATFTSYVAPRTGSGELCAWRLDIKPDTTGVAHSVTREEVLYLLDGELRVTVEGVTHTVIKGDAVLVPAGATLRVDNLGPTTATAWVSTSVGLEGVLADGTRITPPWVS